MVLWVGVLTRRVPTLAVGDPFSGADAGLLPASNRRTFVRAVWSRSQRSPWSTIQRSAASIVMSKSGQSLPPADACFATRDAECLAVVGDVRNREPGVVRSARTPYRAMRRGCQGDTIEMPAEYDRVSVLVKLNRMPHVPAIT